MDAAQREATIRSRWRAAIYLGLLSSTFSTIISQLTAGRIGRDAAVDWMSVAAIPARDWALSAEPSLIAIAIGIAFHQTADFSWALVFFGVCGRWTDRLQPRTLAVLAFPWALLTSGLEWFILVPLFPFFQPIFTLQQPYWIGFLVHLSSASMYPIYAWLRRRHCENSLGSQRFLRRWCAAALVAVVTLGIWDLFASIQRDIPWIGRDAARDQRFMRHMATHHEQGIALATIADEKAIDPHLKSLARLMVASQRGERSALLRWWQSWFSLSMDLCTTEERAAMPGYLEQSQIATLQAADGREFDATFVKLMSIHHAGAVAMADKELRQGSDFRLRLMAHAIRHEQQGEIALMQGVKGLDAVALGFRHMLSDRINVTTAAD